METKIEPTVTQETRMLLRDECVELLRAYGVGSKEDAIRVSKLLTFNGNRETANQIIKCFALVAREKEL